MRDIRKNYCLLITPSSAEVVMLISLALFFQLVVVKKSLINLLLYINFIVVNVSKQTVKFASSMPFGKRQKNFLLLFFARINLNIMKHILQKVLLYQNIFGNKYAIENNKTVFCKPSLFRNLLTSYFEPYSTRSSVLLCQNNFGHMANYVTKPLTP